MSQKKKILILTADAGFGHRSVSLAIEAALRMRYGDKVEVDIINPLDEPRAPAILRETQADYDKWVRKAPEIYKLGYEASDKIIPSAIIEGGLTAILFELMRDIIRHYSPDVIVNTYPLYQHAIIGVLTIFKTSIPQVTVVTDLATVHKAWFNDRVNAVLVPTEIVRDIALDNGIDPKNIYVTGIPVHPSIIRPDKSKSEIRAELDWKEDLFAILAVGSKRVEGLVEAVNVINHFGYPLQLAVVAGKDEELFAELNEVEWHVPVHLYEYVTNMPQLMHASDLIVTKAGGLIVTESLACGLPMMLIDVIPGQETGNMEYVVQHGAGVLADQPLLVLESMAHFTIHDRALLQQATVAAKQLGRPQAAFDAADIIWQATQQSVPVPDLSFRLNFIKLLADNQIPWNEDESLTGGKNE